MLNAPVSICRSHALNGLACVIQAAFSVATPGKSVWLLGLLSLVPSEAVAIALTGEAGETAHGIAPDY